MDLREKIAEAIEKHEASPTKAYLILDAVMGVVEAEHGGEKCVRWDIYEQVCGQMHDAHEEAEAVKARVRELEDENQRMRDDLEAATVFRVGDVQVHKVTGSQATGSPGKWHVAISPASPRWVPSVSYDEDARDAALSRAREIAEEDA